MAAARKGRWFVPVADYEALEREHATLETQLVRERERYDALLSQTLAMKREGFVSQEPQKPAAPPAPKSQVHKTIEAVAGADWKLRKHLADYAQVERSKGESEETIIRRILRWESQDEAGDEVDDEVLA